MIYLILAASSEIYIYIYIVMRKRNL